MHVVDATDSSKMDPAVYQQIIIHFDQVYVHLMKTRKSVNTNDYINVKEKNHVIISIHSGKIFEKKIDSCSSFPDH